MKHFAIFLLLVAICCCICASSEKINPAIERIRANDLKNLENLEKRCDDLIEEVGETIMEINRSEKDFTTIISRLKNETLLARTVIKELLPRFTTSDVYYNCGVADYYNITKIKVCLGENERDIDDKKMSVLESLELSRKDFNKFSSILVTKKKAYHDCVYFANSDTARDGCFIKGNDELDQISKSIDSKKSEVEKQLRTITNPMKYQQKCLFHTEEEDLWMSNEQLENRFREMKERASKCQAKIIQHKAEQEVAKNQRRSRS